MDTFCCRDAIKSATLALPGNGCTVTTLVPGDLPWLLETLDKGICVFIRGDKGTEGVFVDNDRGLAVTLIPGKVTPLVGREEEEGGRSVAPVDRGL